jgi:hypothetical protein
VIDATRALLSDTAESIRRLNPEPLEAPDPSPDVLGRTRGDPADPSSRENQCARGGVATLPA